MRLAACIIGFKFLLKIGATVPLWSLGFNCQRSEVVRARLKPKVTKESNQEKVMREGKEEQLSGEGNPVPSAATKNASLFFVMDHYEIPALPTYFGSESIKNERIHWSRTKT